MSENKILLIGNFNSDSVNQISNSPLKNEIYISRGIISLGHSCIAHDLQSRFVKLINKLDVNFILFTANDYKLRSDVRHFLDIAIKKNIKIAYWNTEGWPNWYEKNIKPFLDWPIKIFSSWELPCDYIWHTQGVDLSLWPKLKSTRRVIDLLFLGRPYNEYRRNILDKLSQKYKVKIVTDSYGFKASEIIAKSKIIFGVGYSSNDTGYSNRIYNTLAAGGCYLTQYVNNIEREFDIGEDIVCWNNIDDIFEKVEYLLKSDDYREYISNNGYCKVINQHQYKHKCHRLLNIILS